MEMFSPKLMLAFQIRLIWIFKIYLVKFEHRKIDVTEKKEQMLVS